jgi:hypothetical protein
MNESASKKSLVGPFLLLTILVRGSIAWAGMESYESKSAPPVERGCEPLKPYEFRIGLPGWISGLSGDFGGRGVVTDQDLKLQTCYNSWI